MFDVFLGIILTLYATTLSNNIEGASMTQPVSVDMELGDYQTEEGLIYSLRSTDADGQMVVLEGPNELCLTFKKDDGASVVPGVVTYVGTICSDLDEEQWTLSISIVSPEILSLAPPGTFATPSKTPIKLTKKMLTK